MDWILSNLSTILISAVLILIFVSIIYTQFKNKKSGKTSCGSNCCHCSLNQTCHQQNKSLEK